MIKTIFTLLLIICQYILVRSQNIGIGTATPNVSAILDITNSSKGLLIPRMTGVGLNAINNPAKGLMVYDSSANQLMVNMGTPAVPNWQTVVANSGWGLTGNVGTSAANNFIGSTDNQPLRFRINNMIAGELNPGTGNIFWGLRSGAGNAAGYSNIAIGTGALRSNTNAINLVAIGDSALYNNIGATVGFAEGGSANMAIGSKALYTNSTGYLNTAIGLQSLYGNTIGTTNTAIGYQSLYTNANGSLNTATGYQALYSNTAGSDNTANGVSALYSNSTGIENTGIGESALYFNNSGSDNTAVGALGLRNNTTGYENTSLGARALGNNVSGYDNTASGMYALVGNTSGHTNTATGGYAMYSNDNGNDNTASGVLALYSNISGSSNTANGRSALYSNTSGSNNTATGYQSQYSNTSGIYNVSDGFESLQNNTTGEYNTATGSYALFNNNGALGNFNTAIGGLALYNTTNSQYNTVVGYNSGRAFDMGYNNTILGANCDVTAAGLFNCIAIGQAVTCTASSQARIGNLATNSIGGTVGWSTLSDGRYKMDLQEDVKGIDFIMKLRPLTYHLNLTALSNKLDGIAGRKAGKQDATTQQALARKESARFTGFVAQEVEQAAAASGYEFSGVDKPQNENDLYGLRYADFVVPLVKAVQEQQQQIELLKKENKTQQDVISDLQKQINEIKALIKK